MKIVIIKYNAGNIRSVDFALQRLGVSASITADPDEIRSADRVIFPGVGEASTTMSYLKLHKLDILIRDLRQPVLGVCLGLQLMCAHSEEGDTTCLGIFPEEVKKFILPQDDMTPFKVPHMGWNSVSGLKTPLFDHISEADYFYFVHSFYATTGADTAATCDYMVPFSAALQRDNFYATQFHPEKSGKTGAKILENFINLIV
ncbi:MAG TPA: imidazole glycerol phosphate synthase subunit HisH [Prolixibacteraceae bacterium]|nr:imidazole glycerol phosphate synthase subunit HisH [Prolixibacteraceae bacterium]